MTRWSGHRVSQVLVSTVSSVSSVWNGPTVRATFDTVTEIYLHAAIVHVGAIALTWRVTCHIARDIQQSDIGKNLGKNKHRVQLKLVLLCSKRQVWFSNVDKSHVNPARYRWTCIRDPGRIQFAASLGVSRMFSGSQHYHIDV